MTDLLKASSSTVMERGTIVPKAVWQLNKVYKIGTLLTLTAFTILLKYHVSCTNEKSSVRIIVLYILYCIEGVVIAAQCSMTFSRSVVLPRIYVLLGREYTD